MSQMAFGTLSKKNPQSAGAKLKPKPVQHPSQIQTSTLPQTILQRKASCACGGDCPRCESEQQKKKKKPRLQTKLKISTPGDQYEQEADRVAEQVMRMTDSQGAEKIAAPPLCGLHLQRKCSACKSVKGNVSKFQEEEETLQPKADTGQADASHLSAGTQAQVTELRGGGQPLAASVREFFEPRFNQDFSRVRIHTDERAAASARAVNALAYTVGHDVAFDAGQYAPETTEGRRLLAHELTHVVQQGGSRNQVQRTFRLNELLSPRGAPLRANPVASNPDTFFYPGSARNRSNRRALVLAGIHGQEVSSRRLGDQTNADLQSGTAHTDFHALVLPHISQSRDRSSGSGSTYVSDLNRDFDPAHPSRNPLATQIRAIVSEFDPERVLSIHAINNPSMGGIYLDPINTGTYPPVGTARERQRAFTGDVRNLEAMHLTEEMVNAAGSSATPGNAPRGGAGFPASDYPTLPGQTTPAGASPYSLAYPQQSQVTTPTSLGTFVSGLGKPIITLEIPGYAASAPWASYLPAVRRFLEIPAASTTAPAATTSPAQTPPVTQTTQPQVSPKRAPEVVRQRTPDIRIQRQSGAGARPAAQPQAGSVPAPQQPGVTQPASPPTSPPPAPPSAVRCRETWEAITVPSTCSNFANQEALDTRKEAWLVMIRAMYARNAEAAACVRGWFIGMVLPPTAVVQEVSLHRNCMLTQMGRDRAVTMRPLEPGQNLESYVEGERRSPLPGYRDFAGQAGIWWRKFTFENGLRPFDRVTQEALDACPYLVGLGVSVNDKWRPRRGNPPHPLSEPQRRCWFSLSSEVRQRQILQASSAPGISRHHFGTDMDFFSTEGSDWEQPAGLPPPQYADEYSWMRRHAARFGFIQPFIQDSSLRNIHNLGYMAEQWHWSYYPIAQALIDFFQAQPPRNEIDQAHRNELDRALFDAQSPFRAAAIANQRTLGDPLSFLAPHWDAYVSNVAQRGSFPERAAAPRR